MFLLHRTHASGLALLCLTAFAAAEPAALTKEEIAGATRTDDFSIPTPGEFMSALDKTGKLAWKGLYRTAIRTDFTSRPQIALNLGTLIADGYIAIQAKEAQSVRNVGKDIMTLAKPLSVKDKIIERGKSLAEFAEKGQWDEVNEDLEAMQNEAKSTLSENNDADLVVLVTVGGWARGTEAISGFVAEHYTAESAKLLRQPGIVGYLSEKLDALPEKMRDDTSVKRTRSRLNELKTAVSFGRDVTPTVDDVKKIKAIATELIKDIAKKETK